MYIRTNVTHMDESCYTYEWVMSHTWMSHVTHMNESCHTHAWVMSHIWTGHVTHMNESCHTYEWVMWHIWMSDVTHVNELCHTYEWVMSHVPVGRGSKRQRVQEHTCLPRTLVVQHLLCMRHDAFIRVTWVIHMCDMTHLYVWHTQSYIRLLKMPVAPLMGATWRIHACDMTHSCLAHMPVALHLLLYVDVTCHASHVQPEHTSPPHTPVALYLLYVWHDAFIHVTCLVHSWDVTHSRLPRVPVALHLQVCVEVSCRAYEWVTLHINESRYIWMSHITYERVTLHIAWAYVPATYVSQIWMGRVTHIRVAHMNESCYS